MSNRTTHARRHAEARYAMIVDPDGCLDPSQRVKFADLARRSHLRAAGRNSATVRQQMGITPGS